MNLYAAWLHNVGHRGAFASHGRRLIVAETPEQIREAFGPIAEPVELATMTTAEWLARDSLALDVSAQVGAVPTVEELRASSRWKPLDIPDTTP